MASSGVTFVYLPRAAFRVGRLTQNTARLERVIIKRRIGEAANVTRLSEEPSGRWRPSHGVHNRLSSRNLMKRKRESRRAGAHHGPRRCLAFIGRCSHPVRIVFEIVKEYKYLGITFSNSGLFGVAVEQIASKSSTASNGNYRYYKTGKDLFFSNIN